MVALQELRSRNQPRSQDQSVNEPEPTPLQVRVIKHPLRVQLLSRPMQHISVMSIGAAFAWKSM